MESSRGRTSSACGIGEDQFNFHLDDAKIAAEAVLDGMYVIRTRVSAESLSTDEVVRSYKLLSQVERAFRSIKTIDLDVRPIHHRTEEHVKAHIFLCMLAQYVVWHLTDAWRSVLFCDEDQEAKKNRDPVAPAERSQSAPTKVHSKKLTNGSPVHSFQTLLKELSTIVRNVCRRPDASKDEPTFHVLTTPNPQQQRAYDLLKAIHM